MQFFRKILILFLLTLAGLQVNAQSWSFVMELLITDDGRKMNGAEIQVYRNGQFVEKVLTDAKGRADIPMSPDGVYTISVSGKNMITKKIEVNTKGVSGITETIYYPAEVDIFPKLDGLNYDILREPIGKVAFDPGAGDFRADADYTKQRQRALQQLTEDYIAKKEEEAAKAKENQKLYDEAIKVADKAFNSQDWELAEKEYKKAAALMPIETYPSFQLAELETKLIKIRATNEKYDKAMAAAQSAESGGDLATAIAEYKRASGYKPDEAAPKDKISELQDKLANAAKAEQNYLAAIEKGDNALKASDLNAAKAAFEEASKIKPSESYPKNKLAEINDILAKKEAKEKQYADAIKAGDDALAAKNYEDAKKSYQAALAVKPGEAYPTGQITKVDGLLAEAAKLEQNYLAAIEKGDNALSAKKYEEAKAAFGEASKLKPAETYPQNKIKEIDQFMAANAAKEKEYQDKIKEADKLLASEDYENAKAQYQAASQLKPAEAYPKEKIAEVEGLLAAIAEKDKNYQAAITKADAALSAKKYEEAKTSYQAALSIKPDEKYPQDKLGEIETIVLDMQKQEEAYKKLITTADAAFSANKLEDAKKSYQEAAALKPTEQYPQDKLAEIDKKVAAQAELEKNYADAVSKADAAMKAEEYDKAEAAYTQALSFKPAETYPQSQLAVIDEKRAELAAAEAAAAKIEADYQAAIKKGDDALAQQKLEEAKTAYQNALSIKKEEAYPQEKITEIDKTLAANAELESNYKNAIAAGDKAFKSEDYEAAKASYELAKGFKPNEAYPADQLKAIASKEAELAAAAAAAEKLEADYQAAIDRGSAAASSKKFDEALVAYTEASTLKPEESLPKEKIEEVKAAKAAAEAALAEEQRLAKLQADFDAAIKSADAAYGKKELEQARTQYQAALALKPEESYPQTKIDEINETLADAAQQDQAYQEAIASADKLFQEEKWEESKAKYAEASSIKSAEAYPKDQIKAIDAKLAALAKEQEEIRLANEAQAKKDAEYQAAVEEGDAAFETADYEKAEASYGKALSIKPAETYPQSQLAAIDEKRAELASKEEAEAAAAAAAAKQAKLDADYQAAVEAGDAAFEKADYNAAEASYTKALSFKPAETYPQSQLAAIDEKRAELASKEEAEAAAAAKAKLEADYQAAISEADNAFNADELEKAEKAYLKALSLKAAETYPQSQLVLIDEKRAAMAAEEQAAAKAAAAEKEASELEAKYQAAIEKGDNAFNANKLDEAEAAYMNALSMKAVETYPQNQLALIDEKRATIALQNQKEAEKQAEEARKAKLEMDYLAAIEQGDQAFKAKNWDAARPAYQKALSLKPSEEYPEMKLREIESTIEAEKAAAALNAEELNKKYQESIGKADQAFSSRAWEVALERYITAQSFKPKEPYPARKIEEIEKILAEKKAKEAARREQLAREAENETAYQTAIAAGDKAFNGKDYNEALNQYNLALGLKSSESYPQEKIDEINAILDKQAAEKKKQMAAKALESQYFALIQSADDAFDRGGLNTAKKDYTEALSIKPNESYPKEQLEKINQKLEEQRMVNLEKEQEQKEVAEDPIQIKSGPKATITTDAEAEIDRMYREMWGRRNSDKNTILESKRKDISEADRAKRDDQASRRENAMENINQITVSLQATNQGSEDFYMQNYETVLDKEEALATANQTWTREAERKRNAEYEDGGKLAKQIMEYNTDRNLEITEGKKEAVEKAIKEVQEIEAENASEQTERIYDADKEKVEKEKAIQAFNKKRAEENLEKTKDLPATSLKDWQDTESQYKSGNFERTENNTQELMNTRKDQDAFAKTMEAKQGNMEYQQQVNDQIIAVSQFHQERKDSYKENQVKIEEKTEVLKEKTKELEAASENRRQEMKDRDFYEGEDLPRQDRMAEEFPQGVSEEIIENANNSTTIRRVVVNGTEVDIYEKTLYAWGGIFYTKNGDNITKEEWDAKSK